MKLIKKIVLLWALLFTAPVVAAPSDFLVTTDWLEKNLNNPKLRLIEVSVDTGVYERGHIQGAVNFKWHTDLVDPVKRDIASKENFEKLLRQAGVNNDSTIVIYGDSNNWFAHYKSCSLCPPAILFRFKCTFTHHRFINSLSKNC